MINFLFHSIKGKLIFAFLFLLGIALMFQFVYIAPTLQKRKVEDIAMSQESFAEYLAGDINSRIEEAIRELEEMASSLHQIASTDKTPMDEIITAINSSNHFFNYFFVMDKHGKWLSYPSHPELVGKRIPAENMSWVNKTFESDKTIFLDVFESRLETLVSGFSTPIKDKKSKSNVLLRGVFVISENNVLVKLIKNVQSIKGFQAFLISSHGCLVAHSNKELNYKEFDSYSMMGYEPVLNALKGQSGITRYEYEDKQWLAAFYPIQATNWGLVVQQPIENIMWEAKKEARFIIFLIIGCFCIGLLIAAVIVQKAFKPLFKLVKDIQAGSIDIISGYPKDEIGQLAFQYSKLYKDLYESNKNIHKSEVKFRTLFNNASDAIYIHDFDGNIIEANNKATEYSGYERDELLKMKVTDIDTAESANLAQSRIEKIIHDKELVFEVLHRAKTGDLIPVEISSRTIEYGDQEAILSVVRDLTERKKIEEQLLHSQKMESVGRLAGGVAHDFNNMLGIILGNTEMILQDLDAINPSIPKLHEIQKAADRSAKLTHQLLAFARKQTISPIVVNPNEIIEGMLKLLRRLIGENIDFAWLPGKSIWTITIDPTQIDQILANLCVNARDAIEDIGKVTIETANISFDSNYCSEHSGFAPGDYVLIALSDNGCGMDKETISNLFEPFFTTKGIGEGTGLGLATVYGIVKQNNGFINVYSEPGKGTTFKVYLPRHVAKTQPSISPEPKKVSVTGSETILLVEDEEAILSMTVLMLERLGYNVIATSNPTEALINAEKSNSQKIHLLMTDVVMPGMNGRDLSKEMNKHFPNLKCLFMSGYTANVIAHHGVLDDGVQFLQKPFSMQDLADKVREVLDEN
jgi:PAS domain S-box-containing protein